jgi:hypothetical protein
MISRETLATVALALALLTQQAAHAAETVVAEDACTVEGFPRALRQTIVVLDELAIEPWAGGDMSDSNRRWINAVISLAGVQEAQRNGTAAPRERITILMGRSNGSDLLRIFTGCPPTFSREEIDQLGAASSGVGRKFEEWLGKDAKSRVEADLKAFRIKMLGALVQLTKDRTKSPPMESKFLSLLPEVGRSFDIGSGIPRVVIFSPLNLAGGSFASTKAAREAGFQQAARLAADLKRAEVYVVRGKSEANALARDYVTSLLLGSKGFLVDSSGETLPALHEPPQNVAVYGGFISYGLVKAPMQIRMAIDSTGALVNSWVEISVDRPIATPMSGKAICKGATLDNCEIKGDGKDFTQAWAIEPDPNKPTFDQRLPFSGIRWFEFTADQKGLNGRFYDPMVIVNKQKEMLFDLAITSHVKF